VIGSFAKVMDLKAEGEEVFVAPPSPDQGLRTYGGQVVAQSLGAAQRTVSADRAVHSIHSYFLKAGRAAEPTELRVERLRDGRSFSQRQVVALQDGAEVMRSLISFHLPEEGLEWEEPITIDVAPPTSEQPSTDYNASTDYSRYTDYSDVIESALSVAEHPWPGRVRPMDVRYVNPTTPVEGQPVTEPQLMWMRVHGPLGDDRALHDAGLAYLADLGMNPVILLPHGYSWRDERITEASLDHTMWFHRPAKADEWLYYDQRVESTSGGRGLASGRFYDLDGHLVATCMQEGLMRWND
jgi:acyl-CoA thioesterase II